MNYPNLSTQALLDHLGLQQKPSISARALTFGALIVGGVVVGAAAALLLAPKSGRALRGDLREGAQQLSDAVSAKARGAVEAAQRKVNERVPAGHNGDANVETSDGLAEQERT